MSEQQRRREDGRGRVGDPLAGDVGRRAVHRLEHRRVGAADVEVAARGEPDAARHRRRQVGQDVTEQVVRDDDVEALRRADHEDRCRVDVQIVGRHVGELLRHRGEDARPEAAGVHQNVRLVYEGEPLTRT